MLKTVTRGLLLVVLVFAPRVQAQPRFAPTPLPSRAGVPPVEVLFSSTPARLFLGWPLVVTVSLRLRSDDGDAAKQGSLQRLTVVSRQGDLSALFRFEVSRFNRVSKRRDVTPLALRPVGAIPRQVVLRPGSAPTVIGHFVLSETESVDLAPAYSLFSVHFDSRTEGSEASWKGTAQASILLEIGKEPVALDANLECEKVLATREYLRVTSTEKSALEVLDSFLSRTHASVAMPCWAARAEFHEQEGNAKAAMVAYCNASRAEGVLLHAAVRENAEKGNIASLSLPRYDAPCERLKRQLKEAAQSAGQPPQDPIRNPESEPRGR